jgi:hypothetical protein
MADQVWQLWIEGVITDEIDYMAMIREARGMPTRKFDHTRIGANNVNPRRGDD